MLSRAFRTSFGFRLFRLFSVILFLIAVVFTFAIVSYETMLIRKDLIREGKVILILLASHTKTWVYAENAEKLKDSLKDVMAYGNIDSVTVFNSKSKVLYDDHKTKTNAHAGVMDYSSVVFSDGDNGAFHIAEAPGTFDITCPVKMEPPSYSDDILYFDRPDSRKTETTIGYIRVGISKDRLIKEVRRIIGRVVVAVLFAISTGLMILIIAIHRVTKPLIALTEWVRQFGRGEAVAIIPVKGDDDIGRLAEAFNTMSLNLTKRDEEKSQLEAKLRKAEKMEALGTLARGIAHDFNNILSTIRGSVYLVEKKFHDHQGLMHYSSEIQQSVSRAQGLINGLLTISRTTTLVFYPIDLSELIIKLRPMIGNILGPGVAIQVDLCPVPLIILGDAQQIERIMLNLVYNAQDAMPGGGKLMFRTAQVEINGSGMSLLPLKPGMYACISVADTGTGVDANTRERIFEPFFTTKESGKGTGLGLAIVYGIIEQHQGAIELDTVPGKGTMFHVWLPLYRLSAGETDKSGQGKGL